MMFPENPANSYGDMPNCIQIWTTQDPGCCFLHLLIQNCLKCEKINIGLVSIMHRHSVMFEDPGCSYSLKTIFKFQASMTRNFELLDSKNQGVPY